MQEAVNSFEGGIMTDLNPLTTPNNVLTDCLNGTFITFNGDEFVLQLDMGNGRVETAYLPSGYVPVGMKEYGGIIYVASYNPLNNKCLIGSFPSPERNITSEESNDTPITIKWSDFGSKDKNGFILSGLYNKYNLFKDSTDTILRPGDKFALAMKTNDLDIDSLKKLVSLFYLNENGTSIDGTRLLKLKLAVLDNNGNLRDILDELKRIELGNDKFVKPYLGYWLSIVNGDNDVDDVRNSLKLLNVYNNKLSGLLYIIAELETIDTFDVSYEGWVSTDDTISTIEVDKYDYPRLEEETIFTEDNIDKVAVSKNSATIKFTSLYTGNILNYKEEDIINKTNLPRYWKGTIAELIQDGFSTTISISSKEDKNEISFWVKDISLDHPLSYSITPAMSYGSLKSYLRSGVIDPKLINSGMINLSEWRYFNDVTSTNSLTISWGLAAYPRLGEAITKVEFVFYPMTKGFILNNEDKPLYTYKCKSRRSYSGSFIDIIPYNLYIHKGDLYIVAINIFIKSDTKDEYFDKSRSTVRFLYTTTAFNELYYNNNVSDFYKEDLPNIKLRDTSTYILKSKDPTSNIPDGSESSLTYFDLPELTPYPIYFSKEGVTTIRYGIDSKVSLEDDKYPFLLELDTLVSEHTSKISSISLLGVSFSSIGGGVDITKESNDSNPETTKFIVTGDKSSSGENVNIDFPTNKIGPSATTSIDPITKDVIVSIKTIALMKGTTTRALLDSNNTTIYKLYIRPETYESVFGYSMNNDIPYPYKCPVISCFNDGNARRLFIDSIVYDKADYDIRQIITLDESGVSLKDNNDLWNTTGTSCFQSVLQNKIQNIIGKLPPIVFLTGAKRGDSDGDSSVSYIYFPLGSFSSEIHYKMNFFIPMIKGSDDIYYLTNSLYDRSAPNNVEDAILGVLETFSKFYIPVISTASTQVYIPNNMTYNLLYLMLVNTNILSKYTTTETSLLYKEGNITKIFSEQNISNIIREVASNDDSLAWYTDFLEKKEESITLKYNNNIKVLLAELEFDKSISSSTSSINIFDDVNLYTNALINISNSILLQKDNRTYFLDHNGNKLDPDTIYWVGDNNSIIKASEATPADMMEYAISSTFILKNGQLVLNSSKKGKNEMALTLSLWPYFGEDDHKYHLRTNKHDPYVPLGYLLNLIFERSYNFATNIKL